MSEKQDEVILAQEQGVKSKVSHLGLTSDLQGTLILSNRNLIFASDEGQTEETPRNDVFGGFTPRSFMEIEDLNKVPKNESNLFIPLSAIVSISGHRGVIGRPNLKLSWKAADGSTKSVEFTETLTGRDRKKNLGDWANVVQRLKSGELVPRRIERMPPADSLEGRILYVLGDMQTKGALEIEEETEKQFGSELEADEVEESCQKLVSMGLVDKIPDASGDSFYKKSSPLGEDDLSS